MKLFVSSTFVDLRDERKAILGLSAPGRFLHGMELFPADPESPLKVALRNLRACEAMLLIIGFKAGSLIPTGRGLTYTRAEFEFARRRRIPIFVFVKTEGGRWRNDETDPVRHDALESFKTEVERDRKPDYFESDDALQRQVVEGLSAWERTGRPGARKLFEEHEQYFRKPPIRRPLFDYEQTLRGRTRQLAELDDFLNTKECRVAILMGRVGLGKSKLLYDWTRRQSEWQVLFLKDRADWHAEVAREIPEGKVLIVINDAHQSEHLEKTARLARALPSTHNTKLLLSLRPTGVRMVESVLSRCFDPQEVKNLTELRRLREQDVRDLAAEVLGTDNQRFVEYLTAISKDAPLVTVVGGRLIASRSIDPTALTGTEEFRRAVFAKFLQEIEFYLPGSHIDFRSILYLVAVVGPISLGSENVLAASAAFLHMRPDEFLYGVDALEKQGIIVRRGYTQRIAPDVLSDFLLEERCFSAGESSGFAEAVYNSFRESAMSNVLLNLAELDWRISRERPGVSLLDRVWQSIVQEFTLSGAAKRLVLMQHIKQAATYQPDPVMRLLRIAMDEPTPSDEEDRIYSMDRNDVLKQIPPLLASMAYHPDFTEEAVQRLWKLAANDERPTQQFPEHAMRVLRDLASYREHKPVSFNLRMAELVEKLVNEPGAFAGKLTPLDIVDELLRRDVEFTRTVGFAFHIGAFELSYDLVKPVRERALAVTDKCLYSENGRTATRALKTIAGIIHGWVPGFGRALSEAEIKWQNAERLRALLLLKRRLTAPPIAMPFVREIYRNMDDFLRWSNEDAMTKAVQEIYDAIRLEGQLFEFHMLCTASYHYHRLGEEWTDSDRRWRCDIEDAACSMQSRIPDPELRVDELIRFYFLAEQFGIEIEQAALANELCSHSAFLNALKERLLRTSVPTKVAYLIGPVLQRVRSRDVHDYLKLGKEIVGHSSVDLVRAAAGSLWAVQMDPGLESDLTLLRRFSQHSDRWVRRSCLLALQRLGFIVREAGGPDDYVRAIVQIAEALDIGTDADLADELCEVFSRYCLPPSRLSEIDIERLLYKLVRIDDLDKHNIGEFLTVVAQSHPVALCEFILERLNRAQQLRIDGNWRYRAVPYDFSSTNFHQLKGSDRYIPLLRTIRDQAPGADYERDYVEMYWRVGALDDETLSVLDEWLHIPQHVMNVLELLSDAAPRIAFTRPWFAFHVLEAAACDAELLQRAIGRLVWNAMPHSWSSAPGEPPPAFVELKQTARRYKTEYESLPLAVKLFGAIEASADNEISRHTLEDQEFDA